MALVVADRVKETTTTTGTGTITLAGASTGYQSFSAIGNGNQTYYTIADQIGSNWEVGIGTYTSSGTTLSRDTVLSSSNAGSLVNFGAGIKDVFVTQPAERTAYVVGTTATFANSGIVPTGSGGTGGSSAQAGMNNLAGAVTSGYYLRGNGSDVVMAAIQAGDVPTLNQNTTGYAAYLQSTTSIGGTHTFQAYEDNSNFVYGYKLRATGTSAPTLFFLDGSTGNWLGGLSATSSAGLASTASNGAYAQFTATKYVTSSSAAEILYGNTSNSTPTLNLYTSGTLNGYFSANSSGGVWMYNSRNSTGVYLSSGTNGLQYFASSAYNIVLHAGNYAGYSAFSGTVSGTTLAASTAITVAGNGSSSDPYGSMAVTEPADANNYSYYGLTRAGNLGAGFGITGTNGALGLGANAYWFGSATPGASGTMSAAWVAFNGSSFRTAGTVYSAGNEVITTANYQTWALPLYGGTMTGSITMTSGYGVGIGGGLTFGIGLNGWVNSGTFDTLESASAGDPLELVYYRGASVKIGSGTYGSKDIYAAAHYGTIFYDSDSTGFYLNPYNPGGAALWTRGEIRFENNSGLTTHFNYPNGSTSNYIRGTTYFDTGPTYITANLYANIFYDNDSPTYYLDPASTGTALNINGGISTPTMWVNYSTGNYNNYNENIRLYPAGNNVSVIAFGASGSGGVPWNSALGFSDHFEIRQGNQWELRSYADYVEAYGSFRAPIFYDSNNVNYFLDPNGASNLYNLTVGNWSTGQAYPGILITGNTGYDYLFTNGSWSSSITAGFLANCNDNWEMAIHDAGTRVVSPFAFYGGGNNYILMGRDIGWGTTYIQAASSFRAPIFYDSDNVSYYLDPNGTSNLYAMTLGGRATTYAMYYQGFTLDANTMSTNSTGFTYAINAPYTGPIARFSTGGDYDLWINSPYTSGGYGFAFRTRDGDTGSLNPWRYPAVYNINSNGGGSLYATIYYDSNDVGYFVDPSSASRLYQLTMVNRLYTYEWIEFYNHTGLYSGLNGAHFYPNNGSYGSWRVAGSRNGWSGLEFDATNGNVSVMINPNSNQSGFHNNNYSWQFFWSDGTIYCYKNSYGGGTQATVLDSANYNNWAANKYLLSPYYTGGSAGVYTGRNAYGSGVYTYNTFGDPNAPAYYFNAIGFGNGTGGSAEIGTNWVNSPAGGIWYRTLRDCCTNWTGWLQILDANNYGGFALPITGGTMTGTITIGGSGGTPITFTSGDAPGYLARCWLLMNSAAPTLSTSGNVSSLAKVGTGSVTVNFTTALSVSTFTAATQAPLSGYTVSVSNRTTTSMRVYIYDTGSFVLVDGLASVIVMV